MLACVVLRLAGRLITIPQDRNLQLPSACNESQQHGQAAPPARFPPPASLVTDHFKLVQEQYETERHDCHTGNNGVRRDLVSGVVAHRGRDELVERDVHHHSRYKPK